MASHHHQELDWDPAVADGWESLSGDFRPDLAPLPNHTDVQHHTYHNTTGPATRFIAPNPSHQYHYQTASGAPHLGAISKAGPGIPSESLAPSQRSTVAHSTGSLFHITNPAHSLTGPPAQVGSNGAQGAMQIADNSTPQSTSPLPMTSVGHRTQHTPTHGHPGQIGASEAGGIGPVRTPSQTSLPNLSPYPRNSTRDSVSNLSQHSSSSDSASTSIRSETLTYIRENYQQLQENLDNHEEFARIGQPLFSIPETERWPAAVALILLQGRANTASPATTMVLTNEDTPNLKTLVSSNIRLILLNPKLDIYGQRGSRTNLDAISPYSMMKTLLDSQSPRFLKQLPSNYNDNPAWLNSFDNLIKQQLKADKFKLSSLIQTNLPSPPEKVPSIKELVSSVFIAMHPRYKNTPKQQVYGQVPPPTRARLAYIRFMINLNRIQREGKKKGETPTIWHQINDDLNSRVGQTRMYRYAFGQLILAKDERLWDGQTALDEVDPDDCALPTEAEIATEIARLGGDTSTQFTQAAAGTAS
ncbi:uncharacterized protein PGTG_10571 [Puccinia graminis f. sp. tritici CRL 75-36-700-3]|uniref:Uncharacterized protein n=1 Tax=Puccinia graminis f. sp. tritici (strain CRL 75-36-700-3 / race SCCL) TaxID=418459 RepID=E3KIR8_PUCGT|nr:uncharacterized protein PGTG_10571 [Puccinia graminis f. sp. tritici CRL 75-36-700-3]EFP84193.2 hypothetical protein PGTG_10571 [Puccinia graminis f. sp. tritici CRL 75-36-700-3]